MKGMLVMQGINGMSQMQGVSFGNVNEIKKEKIDKIVDNETLVDKVELTGKKPELTTEKKQEIMQKAKTKAAGFSIIFEGLSILYYGLRSDKKVAEKFGLDVNDDKKFIKEIKKQQMLWSVPGAFGGLPGAVAWLYNKNTDSSKMKVE